MTTQANHDHKMTSDGLHKPPELQGQIEIEVRSSCATVQVNNYQWGRSCETTHKPKLTIVDFVLSSSAVKPMCHYLEWARMKPQKIGDIMLIAPAHTLHSIVYKGFRRSLSCGLDFSAFEKISDIAWTDSELLEGLDIENSSVRMILLHLAKEVQQPSFASEIKIESLCALLMVELYRHFHDFDFDFDERPIRGTGLSAKQVQRIREQLESGGTQSVTVAELARNHSMSIRHFSRVFRHATGETVTNLIARVRLAQARDLLMEPDSMIKQVAHHCGFQTSTGFSSAFKRATGLTPQQFRDMHMRKPLMAWRYSSNNS